MAAMLSAFTARPIIELKSRDKSKIETILASGDRVLVGLNTGALRVYRLNEPASPRPPSDDSSPPQSDTHQPSHSQSSNSHSHSQSQSQSSDSQATPPRKPTDLLREVERFSTRSIDQLAIIKEANTLVSLSNYHISFHDLQSYELIETISRTKNATCFAVTSNIVKDPATGIPEIISRLAVAVKRRLLLWSWHDSELHEHVTEVVLSEAIRTLTWANATKIVCGMNAGYVLVDVTTSETHEIAGVGAAATGGQGSRFGAASMGYMGLGGYVPRPLAARLAEGEMLLAKDIHSLFIDTDGRPLEKRQVPWQSAPESIGYSYPYMLALQPPAKGSLEVRNPETLNLLQTIELAGAAQLHFPPPNVSLAHAGKGFHIMSDRAVWKMDATDYDTQVQGLIEKGQYDEAISVLSMLEDALLKNKVGTTREVKMLKAEMLFKRRKFRQSLDLFNEDDVHAPPERVLRLYPRIIAGELSVESDEEEEEEAATTEDDENDKVEEEAGAHGGKGAKADSTADAASPVKMSGAGGFAKYWMGGGHRKTDSDAASIASSKLNVTENDDAASIRPKAKNTAEDSGRLEGKELTQAVRELNSFLAGTRARLQRVIDPETGKLRPRKITPGLAQSSSTDENLDALLTDTRSETDEQLEQELRRTFTLVDTTLFRGYMFCQPSLVQPLFRIPNFCDPAVVNEKLLEHNRYNELVDFFYGKKLHQDALTLLRRFGDVAADGETTKLKVNGHDEAEVKIPEQLRGPRRTVGYLQSLPPEMIDLILEFADWVLRRDPDLGMEIFLADSENAETLPRGRVVTYLSGIDAELEIRYLEHIVDELNDGTPEFHNRLVELLINSLRDDTNRGGKWEERLQELVTFLKESHQYGLTRAFGMIPRDDPPFYEAQAVVLSNMGNHKQALEIYVFKMQDYVKAEEYCNRTHALPGESPSSADSPADDQGDSDAPSSIYHTLLSLYLTPPPPHKANLEPALSLLSRHGSRLPATSTLSLIPDTLPIADLASYFRGRIRAANSVVSETRIVEALRKTQLVNTQARLLFGDESAAALPGLGVGQGGGGRNRRVVIPEERVCGVCHKRLGNSVVAVLPDNSVVHYGCLGKGQGIGGGRGRSASRSRVAGSWGRHH